MALNKIFDTVYWDIVNICNARCKYCLTGISKCEDPKFIESQIFEKGLDRLLEKGIISTEQSVVSLYNWGEPFLHPKLSDLIEILNKRNLKYAFSTNANKLPVINKAFVENLDHIIISMPGFSQNSYDKIHGFKFEHIKNNIAKLVKSCNDNGFKGYFSVSMHVYQFNLDELEPARIFCENLGIRFNPYYAILNNWDELVSLADKNLTYDKLEEISQDLLMFDFRQKLNSSPDNYECPQKNYLIIDEDGNIMHCCQLPKGDPDHISGSIFDEDIEIAINNRQNTPVCSKCLSSGLAYYINNSLRTPEFYKTNNFVIQEKKSLFKKLFKKS